ncbi:DNA/RNA-binding domain E.t1.c1-type [Penicillium capsulatum]|uniref:DNA/RNA-binding domain E.t1.c1-type n=1 Tax=Penicillium capsulatum TaxID=69766 RepID=A0A9W9HPT1_9EURO|nr:DNA/RNA-binding domain E.t1.c1-type [Penicillium capsulatum]KAJ6114168.1 DNA/RNA-binding domain E.t1.c1-type [Penicillium capsulatum]
MANRVGSPASGPISTSRPNSSVLADDCTLDTHSNQGGRIVNNSPHAKFRQKHTRPRGRSSAEYPSQLLPHHHDGSAGDKPKKSFNVGVSELPGKLSLVYPFKAPPQNVTEHQSYSTALVTPSANLETVATGGDNMEIDTVPVQPSSPFLMSEDYSVPDSVKGTNAAATEKHAMFKQPQTNTITEEQLINEVRGIYAGLVMVEKKCIQLDKQHTESKEELSDKKWVALIRLHQTLLYEHHDFFLASQHPSASPVLKHLADKYAMSARMWRYGIYSFLELLRQRLPESLDYMLNFVYLAYSMITLLLESISALKETWIKCLGDLARYRMAIEESDMRDRKVWAGVSRYWYNQDADRSPDIGRIQHHLAVLTRPDILQQLFYYTKALVSPLQQTMMPAFIATHGILFTRGPTEQFITLANHFLALLRKEIGRLGCQGQQGVYMMCCNFASVLQYGDADAVMTIEFWPKGGENVMGAYVLAREWMSQTPSESQSSSTDRVQLSKTNQAANHNNPHLSSQIAFQGSLLGFHTLSVFLNQMGDSTIYPSVHTSLAFIWCLALRPTAMQPLESLIPWLGIAKFLNTLVTPKIEVSKIEGASFPLPENTKQQQLPEDFLIRGQAWSHLYYAPDFFEGAPSEDERPLVEAQNVTIPRKHRCLWLGVRLETFGRWITYSRSQGFESTELALEFAPIAETCGHLDSKSPLSNIDSISSNIAYEA